jgi:hypothetical protein
MNAAAWSASTRGGGGTRGLRQRGARGVRGASAHVRIASMSPPDATTATLASPHSRPSITSEPNALSGLFNSMNIKPSTASGVMDQNLEARIIVSFPGLKKIKKRTLRVGKKLYINRPCHIKPDRLAVLAGPKSRSVRAEAHNTLLTSYVPVGAYRRVRRRGL